MSPEEPVVEVTVAASAAEVWDALRDPEKIRGWFGWEYDGIEGEIALIFAGEVPEGIELPEGIDTSIEVDDEARTLRTGPHRIEVADSSGRAVVRVTRALAPGDAGWEGFAEMIDQVDEGWVSFFQTLAFAVAHHPGEPRRTAFGSGPVPAADLGSFLGLADLAALAPGDAYSATVAGDAISGSVWFRSAHQIGLTVDAWGDGLLVAAVVPGNDVDARPVMAIASTYGLPDADHAALEARWQTWWSRSA